MNIDRFASLSAIKPSKHGVVLLAVLAWACAAQAQIPGQQRLVATTAAVNNAASAVGATANAMLTATSPAASTNAAASASSTSNATSAASMTPEHHATTHHRVYHHRVVRHHVARESGTKYHYAPLPQAGQTQTYYQGTTVAHPANQNVAAVTTPEAQVAVAAPAPAPAPAAPEKHYRDSEIGHSTSAWLNLQASNREAAPDEPMLGAAATAAYQRYLDSFKHPIPDSFGSKLSAGTGGGGGGSAQ